MPRHSHHPLPTIKGITAAYNCRELQDVPLAAQLMGSNPELLALAAVRLVTEKGAPRIDLNCGKCAPAAGQTWCVCTSAVVLLGVSV